MKITAIKPYSIHSPVTDWTYVKVETDEPGIFGWGECSLPGKPQGVVGAIRDMEKLVLGMDPLNIALCWQRMYRHGYWRGGPIHTTSISGIDNALWDIRGKVEQKPVYQLLGGAVRQKVKLYANCGLSTSPEVFKERTLHALSMGYKMVKIYPLPAVAALEGPATIRQVVACCEAVRETLGESMDFALDFHGRCTAAIAVELEAALRHTRPLWIEEPVVPESPQALKKCAEQFKVPVAVGERLFTRWDFRAILENQWADIIEPDVSNAGGITEMVRIADMAELYGVAFNPHNPNGPLQSQTSLHLAFHCQAFSLLEHRHENHDFLRQFASAFPLVGADGYASMPEGVGLGVEIDEEFLKKNPARNWIPESFRADGSVHEW
jgi:galactonate dehydratase